eukprot:TRINITY_DN11189_c0_g1_i1.p1 TRINITY_DN11189_c0_g1~~TRINITY_DN11189_c0_g1_i1.p1  ORF type:complete len:509 (+),score=39.35 TRINITY_DN11189_c0_g1_i1:41-1567(+)
MGCSERPVLSPVVMPTKDELSPFLDGKTERDASSLLSNLDKFCMKEGSLVVKVMAPLVVRGLGQYGLNLIGMHFVNIYAPEHLAGVTLGMSLTAMLGWAAISGLSTALTTLTSQYHGATHKTGKTPDAYLNVGFVTHMAWTLVPAFLLPFTYNFLVSMGQETVVAYDATVYFAISILALPANAFFITYRRYLEALLRPWAGAILCGSGLFVFPVILFVVGTVVPAQHTVPIAMIVLFTVYSYIVHKYCGVSSENLGIPPTCGELKEYVGLALPAMLSMMAEWWSSEVLVVVSGKLNTASLTANAVVNNLVTVIYQTSYAVGSSCSVRVGFWLGAGKPKRAKQALLLHSIIGLFVSFFIVYPLLSYPGRVATVLVGRLDAQTVQITTDLIPIICYFYILDTFQASLNGTMCGAGLQRISLCFALFAYWPIGIPVGLYLGFSQGLGAVGFWYGLWTGLCVNVSLTAMFLIFVLDWDRVMDIDRLRSASSAAASALDEVGQKNYGTMEGDV